MKSNLRYFIRLTRNRMFLYFTGSSFESWAHPNIQSFTTEEKAIAVAQVSLLSLTPYDPARGTLVEGEITILRLIPHAPNPATPSSN